MNSLVLIQIAGAFFLATSAAAWASPCTERMDALEARIRAAAETTASVSSGGQGVAAAREAQAMQSRKQGKSIAPSSVPPFQDNAQEAHTTRRAAEVGGGEQAMQALAMINRARVLYQQGDSPACLEAIGQVEGLLSGAP
jgi:hypothetical protein